MMGLSILIYMALDGFDLGVGLLMLLTDDAKKDRLIGLILRGVSFEMRAKAPLSQKRLWNAAFFGGSLMASLSQGFMLGMYIMGLTWTVPHVAFALLTAVFLTFGYSFIGAVWLIWKTEDALQIRALGWAKGGIWGLIFGIAAISIATPIVSTRIFEKWFSWPEMLYLSPLPIASAGLIAFLWWQLGRLPLVLDAICGCNGALYTRVRGDGLFVLSVCCTRKDHNL